MVEAAPTEVEGTMPSPHATLAAALHGALTRDRDRSDLDIAILLGTTRQAYRNNRTRLSLDKLAKIIAAWNAAMDAGLTADIHVAPDGTVTAEVRGSPEPEA